MNKKIKLITHLCCLFSTILGSLSQEMLYCHVIVVVNAISVVQRRIDRSSHRKFSIKKGVLTNFSKFTGKHLCQSLLLNFPKFVGPLFITNHLWRTASAFRTMSNIYDRTFLWKQQVVTVFEKKTQPQPCTGVSL